MRRTILVLGAVMAVLMFAMVGAGAALADTVFSTSDSPTTKEDCKNGGYAKYGFKNQGQCIKAVKPPPDTTAPNVQITSGPADGSSIPTRQATFEFSSPDSDLAHFDCSIRALSGPGVPWEDVDPNCTSPWTFAGLVDGTTYEFKVTAFDNAENSQSAVRTFTIDTTPPVVTITSGPEGQTEDNTPTYEFSVSEPARVKCSYELTFPGETTTSQSGSKTPCSSPNTETLNQDGTYVFGFQATDNAGNVSEVVSRTMVLDHEPETRIISGPEGDYSNVVYTDPDTGQDFHDVTYEITSQWEAKSTFECRLTPGGGSLGTEWTACGNIPSDPTFTIERVPGDGVTRTFEVRAIDHGGRVDQTPASRTFTLPDTSPM